ncbi:hypothetical protein [Kiloniella antarctica]|uniref:HicB-like antitoxin of toxin-antitoxin system domain-containing protein n=1 Tax=Kiloniella antarctica TaxID=1550907 RepID=A0ABW5BSB9_9PROT
MTVYSRSSSSSVPEPFRVTVFAPGKIQVRSLELIGTRTQAEAIDMSRNLLLEYLEQGHTAGGVELCGKGITHWVYRETGNSNLKESDRADFIEGLG